MKKTAFIEFITKLIEKNPDEEMNENASAYWEALKQNKTSTKTKLTDNGKLIMQFLQENAKIGDLYKSKDIAEGLLISSRSVSGAMNKLVADGYVEKLGKDPILYSITEAGINLKIEE